MLRYLYFLVPIASFFLLQNWQKTQKDYVPIMIGLFSLIISLLGLEYYWNLAASSYDLTLEEFFSKEGVLSALIQDSLFVLIRNVVGIFPSY